MQTFTEVEQTRIYKGYHGWTAETRIKIYGKNWQLTTSKNNNGKVSTHCHAVQDEGNGSISFVMFGGDAAESFHVNIVAVPMVTEKAITTAHADGLKAFYAKRDAGELPKLTEEEVIKIGQVLFTDGNGPTNRRAVYEIANSPYNHYKTVLLDGTKTMQDNNFIRPISKKFGIGVYFKPGDTIPEEEVVELLVKAIANMKVQAELDEVKRIQDNKAAAEKKAYLSQFKVADRRTTTAIVKRHILATWPAVQMVGIRTDSFSGGDSMDVTYHAPERIEELETFVRSFREGVFNGMNDMYEYAHDKSEIILEGHILQTYKFASSEFVKCEERAAQPITAPVSTSATGVTITHNKAKDGIEIRFSSKPAESVLSDLKAAGFRWGKFGKCWYKTVSSSSKSTAAKYGTLPASLTEESDGMGDYIEAQLEAGYN